MYGLETAHKDRCVVEELGNLNSMILCILTNKNKLWRWMWFEQKVFAYDWLAPSSYFECFYFFLQKGRTWRFSVCPFYVRVEPLYTLRRKPAESVTVDFFIGDPSHSGSCGKTDEGMRSRSTNDKN